MKSSDIRNHFVDYFKKQGHTHVPSSSLIPENDPTLLFAHAGQAFEAAGFNGFGERVNAADAPRVPEERDGFWSHAGEFEQLEESGAVLGEELITQGQRAGGPHGGKFLPAPGDQPAADARARRAAAAAFRGPDARFPHRAGRSPAARFLCA